MSFKSDWVGNQNGKGTGWWWYCRDTESFAVCAAEATRYRPKGYACLLFFTKKVCHKAEWLMLLLHYQRQGVNFLQSNLQLLSEAGMEDLSGAIVDFLDEICPHVSANAKSSTQVSSGTTSSFSEGKVVTALHEAATWADEHIKEGKLYVVCVLKPKLVECFSLY